MIIEILMAKPASGKTFYAETKELKESMTVSINLDRGNLSDRSICNKIKKLSRFSTFILDGLFLSNDEVEQLVDSLKAAFPVAQIKIIYWEPNVEQCVKNDNWRVANGLRNKSAEATIRHCELDDPRKSKKLKKLVETRQVWTPKEAQLWAFSISHDGILRSSSWCLGGQGRNYNRDTFGITGESPREFEELDNLLLDLYPNISFLEYKQVLKLTEVVEFDSNDYYSQTTSARWEISLVELYNKVKELKSKKSEQTSVSI